MTALATYCWADHALACGKIDHWRQMVRFEPREAAVFGALLKRMNRVVKNDFLIGEIYPNSADECANPQGILKVYICKIRRKIRDADAPIDIKCVWGTGYVASGHVEIDWTGL